MMRIPWLWILRMPRAQMFVCESYNISMALFEMLQHGFVRIKASVILERSFATEAIPHVHDCPWYPDIQAVWWSWRDASVSVQSNRLHSRTYCHRQCKCSIPSVWCYVSRESVVLQTNMVNVNHVWFFVTFDSFVCAVPHSVITSLKCLGLNLQVSLIVRCWVPWMVSINTNNYIVFNYLKECDPRNHLARLIYF